MLPALAAPLTAIVRAVPDAYLRCLRSDPAPIDLDRARAQHRGHVAALTSSSRSALGLLAGRFVMLALPLVPRTVPKSPGRGLPRSSPGR